MIFLSISNTIWAYWLQQRTSKQEAQGLGALLDKMEDNDHIKLDNIRDFGQCRGAC